MYDPKSKKIVAIKPSKIKLNCGFLSNYYIMEVVNSVKTAWVGSLINKKFIPRKDFSVLLSKADMERFKKECQKFLDTLLKYRRIMTIRLDITFLDQNEKQSRKVLSRILKKLQKDYNGLLVNYHGIFEFNGTKSKDKYHTHLLLCFDGNKKISIPTMQDGIKKWLIQEADRNNYYISFHTPYHVKKKTQQN